jgi:hypothetical protein
MVQSEFHNLLHITMLMMFVNEFDQQLEKEKKKKKFKDDFCTRNEILAGVRSGAEVEAVASHSEKQSIFAKHFKRHSGEATDLFQFVRLLIPKDDARTYAMKEKSLCKVLARVFAGVPACDAALLTAHFTERGDIAATAEHAFVSAQSANHAATRGAAGGALSVARRCGARSAGHVHERDRAGRGGRRDCCAHECQ